MAINNHSAACLRASACCHYHGLKLHFDGQKEHCLTSI